MPALLADCLVILRVPLLELQPQRELEDARLRHRAGALAKGIAVDELGVFVFPGNVRVRNGRENRVVENVKCFGSEGELEALGKVEVLRSGSIPVEVGRAVKGVQL